MVWPTSVEAQAPLYVQAPLDAHRPAGTFTWSQRAWGYVALTKPRIVEQLLITTLPTMFVAKRGLPSVALMATTLAGGALAAGGANAFNMVIDRDIDKVMRRTRRRPLVTGQVTVGGATAFACGLEVAAFAALWLAVNLLSAVLALAAAAFYVFVYTLWLKRSSSQNIVIGGAAGAVPVLVGWSAVTGRVGWPAVVLFALIVLWTPPHFWALAVRYRKDYQAVRVPMLPAVRSIAQTARRITIYSVLLVGTSLALVPVAHMGVVYIAAAIVLGAWFLVEAARFHRRQTDNAAMALFRYSILYLTLLFAAMALDALVHMA